MIGAIIAGVQGAEQISSALSSGTKTDQQRQARCNDIKSRALAGNVYAAQCLLGGQQNTASHERPMYDAAIAEVTQSDSGAAALAVARSKGAYWSASDSAASYPQMTAYMNAWNPTTSAGPDPIPAGGLNAPQQLPTMTSTATAPKPKPSLSWGWIAAGTVALIVVVMLAASHRRS